MGNFNLLDKSKNILLLVTSSLFSLILLEFGVRIFFPQDKKVTWIEMHETGFVMNQKEGQALHEFGPRTVHYTFTNERTRGELLKLIDSTDVNIITIGDSFTFGLLLEQEDTFVSHLQNWADTSISTEIKFHNAAIGGAGIADWPLWLEEYGKTIQPSKVIYFLNNQDVVRGLSKNLFVISDTTNFELRPSQRWKPRAFFQYLNQKNWYRFVQEKSELANIFVKILWRYVYFEDVTNGFSEVESKVIIPKKNQFNIYSDYSLILSIALLDKLKDWCITNNCDLIVANTGFFEPKNTDPHTLRFHEYLKKSSEDEYIDLYPCVAEFVQLDFKKIQIQNDNHPNEIGSKIIFECLKDRLRPMFSNKLLQ